MEERKCCDVGDVHAEDMGDVKAEVIWTGGVSESIKLLSFGASFFGFKDEAREGVEGSSSTISPLMHLQVICLPQSPLPVSLLQTTRKERERKRDLSKRSGSMLRTLALMFSMK